jgi:hypothetical protein
MKTMKTISTKPTTASRFKELDTKRLRNMALEVNTLAWNRQTNVAELD